jgi:hypothetical protein
MKAVGNNPLERYVGPETGARHHPTSNKILTQKINSTASGRRAEPTRPRSPKSRN